MSTFIKLKFYFIICLFLGVCQGLQSQVLTVVKFELRPDDTEAYFNEVKDLNGNKCALVKVLLNNIPVDKISFQTSGIEIPKQGPGLGADGKQIAGEYWVYLPHQTENLRITTIGYGNYERYPFSPVKSTKTYSMELRTDVILETKQKVIEPEFIIITTIPEAGVEVLVDNVKKGLTPLKNLKLLPGIHVVKLNKALYYNQEVKIDVKADITSKFSFTLKPKFGKLIINSVGEYNGAQVYIDEEEKCQTPCEVPIIKSGEHQLLIRKDLYKDYHETFIMEDGGVKQIPNLTLVPSFGILNISTTPVTADIYINKLKLGIGVLRNHKLSAGEYFIESKNQNYKSFQKNVKIEEGRTTNENFVLEPLVDNLSIETEPIECEIY